MSKAERGRDVEGKGEERKGGREKEKRGNMNRLLSSTPLPFGLDNSWL